MRQQKFVVAMVAVLCALLPVLAEADPQQQESIPGQRRIIACPKDQIPAEFSNFKRWELPNVAVYPVIEELYGGDPFMVQKYLNGPTAEDTGETRAKLERGHARLVRLFALEGFTPPGTPIEKAPATPPQQFLDDLREATKRTEDLKYRIVPCGTLLSHLSWAMPDPPGSTTTTVIAEPGPWVLAWCEPGVRTPEGKCGARVVDTPPIPVKSGPNSGQELTVRIYLICGNPDMLLERVTLPEQTVTVTPEPTKPAPVPTPAPTPQPPPTVQPKLVLVVVPKELRNQKGELVSSRPKDWEKITFGAEASDGVKTFPRFDGSSVRFSALPGTTVVLWEDPATLPKKVSDETRRLVVTIPADTTGMLTVEQRYVNVIKQGKPCGKYAWRCWIVPVVGGGIYALTRDGKPPAQAERKPEPPKGGSGVTGPGNGPG